MWFREFKNKVENLVKLIELVKIVVILYFFYYAFYFVKYPTLNARENDRLYKNPILTSYWQEIKMIN